MCMCINVYQCKCICVSVCYVFAFISEPSMTKSEEALLLRVTAAEVTPPRLSCYMLYCFILTCCDDVISFGVTPLCFWETTVHNDKMVTRLQCSLNNWELWALVQRTNALENHKVNIRCWPLRSIKPQWMCHTGRPKVLPRSRDKKKKRGKAKM